VIRVFVSYRSADAPFAAVVIDKVLSEWFGREQVFFDNRSIRPGRHFPPEIWRALNTCQVLIAVIGPNWLEPTGDGLYPLDDPDDYLRREIAVALARDVLVVPVLVGAAMLPEAHALPADIAGLASRQYLRLRVRDSRYDLMRLVDELEDLIGGASPRPERPAGDWGDPSPAATNHFHAPVAVHGAVFGNAFESSFQTK